MGDRGVFFNVESFNKDFEPSFPCKIFWHTRENVLVTAGQLIAVLVPYKEEAPIADDAATSSSSDLLASFATETRDKNVDIAAGSRDDSHGVDGDFSGKVLNFDVNYSPVISRGECLLSRPTMLTSTVYGRLTRHIVSHNSELVFSSQQPICCILQDVCTHQVVIHGLCVTCCQPVNQAHTQNAVHAGFISNASGVLLSKDRAAELERHWMWQLIASKKLCLILDLDNTLLHASSSSLPIDLCFPILYMDPGEETAGFSFSPPCSWTEGLPVENFPSSNSFSRKAWMHAYDVIKEGFPHYADEENFRAKQKLHELETSIITAMVVEKSGRSFQCFYKLRPHVFQFLRKVSSHFELYLYTMGTADHARASLFLLDPQRRFFGQRVFSREDGFEGLKSIKRIFPFHKKMVIVVDDSEHVWQHIPSCIKVHGYYFFPELRIFETTELHPAYFTKNVAMMQAYAHCHSDAVRQTIHSLHLDSRWPYKELLVNASESSFSSWPFASSLASSSCFAASTFSNMSSTTSTTTFISNSTFTTPTLTSTSSTSTSLIFNSASPTSASTSLTSASTSLTSASTSLISASTSLIFNSTSLTFAPTSPASVFTSLTSDSTSLTSTFPIISPSTLPSTSLTSASSSLFSHSHAVANKQKRFEGDEEAEYFVCSKRLKGTEDSSITAACLLSVLPSLPPPEDKEEDFSAKHTQLPSLCSLYSSAFPPVEETDKQLLYLEKLLCNVHTIFFDLCQKQNILAEETLSQPFLKEDDTIATTSNDGLMTEAHLPCVATILEFLRRETLHGITLASSGLRCSLFPSFQGLDFGHLATCFGARIQEHFDEAVTHLLCFGCTNRYQSAVKAGIPTVHLMWLEFAFYTWSRPDDSLFSYSQCHKNYHSFWDVLKDLPVSGTLHEEIVQFFCSSKDLFFPSKDSDIFQAASAASNSDFYDESLPPTQTQEDVTVSLDSLTKFSTEKISAEERINQLDDAIFQTSDAKSESSDTETHIWGDFWDQLQKSSENSIE